MASPSSGHVETLVCHLFGISISSPVCLFLLRCNSSLNMTGIVRHQPFQKKSSSTFVADFLPGFPSCSISGHSHWVLYWCCCLFWIPIDCQITRSWLRHRNCYRKMNAIVVADVQIWGLVESPSRHLIYSFIIFIIIPFPVIHCHRSRESMHEFYGQSAGQVGRSAQLSLNAINPTSPILVEHQTVGEWSSIVWPDIPNTLGVWCDSFNHWNITTINYNQNITTIYIYIIVYIYIHTYIYIYI